MDLFQRLLGTLQQTVDYISTFTTYLLGDEAHPRAEASGSTRETVPHSSHHEHEVEAAHYGDISPAGNLKAFEDPPIAEIIPPHWEIQEPSGKNFSCAQVTEPSLRPSKLPCKYEGKEDVGRRLSEPANFLADVPKPKSMRTRSLQQRDLDGPSVPGGLHYWEPEGRDRMGAVQQELLEEMADTTEWKPEKPLAGGQEQKELGGSGEAEGLRQKEEKEMEGYEQEAPGRAEFEEEEQRGLDGAAQTGEFQQEVAKMAEGQQPEVDRQLVGGIKMEDSQQEPDTEAGNEGVQKAVPDSAETGGYQQGGQGGKTVFRNSLQGEPKETGTLEEDPKGVAERRDSQRLEGAETEGHQLEGSVGNEGTQWREQEESEGDERVATVVEESVVEEERGDGRTGSGKFQEEVARMVEAQWLEAEGQLAGAQAENYKPDMEAEGALQAVPDDAETRADQQAGLEAEAEVRRKLQWEPEETLEQHPEKGNSWQQGLEVAEEREEHQHGELEGLVRIKVETEEDEWEEQMGEATLEMDQQTDKPLLGTTALDEEVVGAGREDPEVEGQETERTEKSLLPEPMTCNAPLDIRCLAGAGTFPPEVPSLDTSAQKERVLLRRKSSIRRAPSLKRPRPPMQTPPLETGIVENSPSQPPALSRPNLRHAGFGPMHPSMMSELQMRLRRPK